MAVFDAPDREGMALLAPTVGLGLAPDPADPAVRIRRIRLSGSGGSARILKLPDQTRARARPRVLKSAQNSPKTPPKRPKKRKNPPELATLKTCQTGSGRHSIRNPSPGAEYEALFHVLLFSAFRLIPVRCFPQSTFPCIPIPGFCAARLELFSHFRGFAALLRNVPIQVPKPGPDRQVAFRCLGIRGQEIWAGPHRRTEETPGSGPSSRHLRRRRRHRAPSSSVTRHVIRRRAIAHRCCGHIMCGRVAPEAPCKAAWCRHRWCQRVMKRE